MPEITSEKRAWIDGRLARRREIEDLFTEQYMSQPCHLCNWASNGLDIELAVKANEEHQKTHPEFAEWKSLMIPMEDLVDIIHDHECQMASCACKCGCVDSPFCKLIFGPLCGSCIIRANRGDSDHGEVEG